MIRLHPHILEKDGEKAFAVLPYEEFVRMQQALEDYEDLRILRAAKAEEAHAPTISFEEVKKSLEI